MSTPPHPTGQEQQPPEPSPTVADRTVFVPSASPPAPPRRIIVHIGLAALTTLFLLFLAIIYSRSWLHRSPTAVGLLVVYGSEQIEGAQFMVEDRVGARVLEGKITPENNYTCDFRLPSGIYKLRWWLHAQEQRPATLVMRAGYRLPAHLPTLLRDPPTTAPTTRAN